MSGTFGRIFDIFGNRNKKRMKIYVCHIHGVAYSTDLFYLTVFSMSVKSPS